MPDLNWLDGYSGESVDELIALEGTYRTDSLVLAFEQAMDQKAARVGENKTRSRNASSSPSKRLSLK
jgi:hypothetical protein